MLYFVIVLFSCALALPANKIFYDIEEAEQLFEDFIIKYNKEYTPLEKREKIEIFKANLEEINKLNKEHGSHVFGINSLTDLSTKDFEKRLLGSSYTSFKPDICENYDLRDFEVPAQLDWRQSDMVSPVKDQGTKCGSCWAFSVTGAIESQLLVRGVALSLSEQQLIDCDKSSYGCHGGWPPSTMSYIIENGGILSEDKYPYEAKEGKCHFNASSAVVKLSTCYHVATSDSVKKWKQALWARGPLSVIIDGRAIQHYTVGVFNCKPVIANHFVLLIGYGEENGKPYWLIKNSWGTKWGEEGYMKLAIDSKSCEIYQVPPLSPDLGDLSNIKKVK